MKRIEMLVGLLLLVGIFSGCGTFRELGITKEMAVAGAMIALERNDLGGVASQDEVGDIAEMVGEIMTRETALSNKLDEIAARKQAQDKISEIMGKFVVDGVVIDPDAVAVNPDAKWEDIVWVSENYAGAEYDFDLSARCSGNTVFFTYPEYSWEKGSSGSTEVDAVACFFVWNGSQWEGGKFEFIRPGGQSSKSLGNIKEGYGGLKAPASGARVAFAWVSLDGKRRTSLAETVWP